MDVAYPMPIMANKPTCGGLAKETMFLEYGWVT